ncbi:MAG: discoidin domain-containing protein [Methylomicrobium sp.]
MKKRIIADISANERAATTWLNLEALADVEITSESSEHPIEGALLSGTGRGWRAAKPGMQTIRLLFKKPQDINRIHLIFLESAIKRTQEYVLRGSRDEGQTWNEIVRQQWNFSPDGSTRETEDYTLALPGVTALELIITPDISGQRAFASLEKLRIA